jgi:hypothetical protein
MGEHSAVEQSTQSAYPWRAVARTVVAFLIAILPYVAAALADASTATQSTALIAGAGVAGAITKALANPAVDALLKRYLPALSATPRN